MRRSKVTEKSLIIIGAGLAGLSTGCFAQMNGYQSHIFEHHSKPGGVAAAWRRGDYLIDGGIHFVMGYKPGTALYDLFRQLGIVPANRFVDLTAYGRFVHEPSGQSLLLADDLDQWAATLRSLSPADALIVDELITGGRAMQGLDLSEVGLGKPPELAGLMDQAKDLWAMRRFLRYMFGEYGRPVAGYVRGVHDPVLRACIERLFLPEVPVYFIFMLLGLLAGGQMGLIEGGSLEFARSIEKRYSELGGTVSYRATVEEILVEGGRAVGVRLADGTEHRADAVVSAADGHSTLFKMLGGRYLNDKIVKRYATWKTTQPLLMASYGVAKEFPDEPPFTTIVLEHPLNIGQQAVDGIFVRLFNYSPRFAPAGKTVVQVEFETEWEYWYNLQSKDRAHYEAEKERVAAELLQRLEAHYPGLSSCVEVTDVVTPYTTWRYTHNYRGAWGGWLMTPEAIRTTIERTLPGLSGLYMAGQWVMPGGGVSSCLYSGRHAVQLLCRHEGKPFETAVP
jgi:phytoene desaturase